MKVADAVFDVAAVGVVLSVLVLIWTLSFVAVQAVLTCAFVAGLALYAAARTDEGPPAPQRPFVGQPPPREDFVSEEEYDESPIAR